MIMAWEGLKQKALCSCQAGQFRHLLLYGIPLSAGTKGNSWLSQDVA